MVSWHIQSWISQKGLGKKILKQYGLGSYMIGTYDMNFVSETQLVLELWSFENYSNLVLCKNSKFNISKGPDWEITKMEYMNFTKTYHHSIIFWALCESSGMYRENLDIKVFV